MRVAITGGIGEGKSTVLGFVRDLGFEVASSDEIARRLFQDPSVNRLYAHLAGKEGAITAQELREAISRDDGVRRRINRLAHPLVRQGMDASLAPFHEVPLLVEACLHPSYERVWVVTCGEEEQRRRLLERYGSEEAVDRAVATQLSPSVKCAFADRIIRTNCPLESVRQAVAEAVAALTG